MSLSLFTYIYFSSYQLYSMSLHISISISLSVVKDLFEYDQVYIAVPRWLVSLLSRENMKPAIHSLVTQSLSLMHYTPHYIARNWQKVLMYAFSPLLFLACLCWWCCWCGGVSLLWCFPFKSHQITPPLEHLQAAPPHYFARAISQVLTGLKGFRVITVQAL